MEEGFIVRADRKRPASFQGGEFVECDASFLPFRGGTFYAVIANHCLEHFDDLTATLAEIARVLRRDGCLYVAVPDASTVTDRLYRRLFHGGEHVNQFRSAPELARLITCATGLPLIATLVLHSSLHFLQGKRFHPRPPRRMWLIGNGNSRCIAILTYALRIIDKMFGTRLSVYGWALYFGNVPSPVEVRQWTNVCVDCGVGYPAAHFERHSFLSSYRCSQCGAWNLITKD